MMKWMRFAVACVGVALLAGPAMAQQTGTIVGRVTSPDGEPIPGVRVEASSEVLPQARQAQTGVNGEYRLPLLPPGQYELLFALEGMASEQRAVLVQLQQTAEVNATMAPDAVSETVEVIGVSTLVDTTSAELKSAISEQVIESLPVGQEYRDLIKLIPGVQYTEDAIRGPSAGGNGQDNVYLFDGVNVGLPLFGNLSAEPSSHDVDQIAVIKGGAKAVDFNRSGGFTINSISKTGTSTLHGEVSYQIQTEDMTGDRDNPTATQFEEDKDWTKASLGGPILKDRLFFYGSYYRPTIARANRSNSYGEVVDLDSTRDEFYGKLSLAPTASVLLHGSYRTSDREVKGASVSTSASASTTSLGEESTQDIAIAEGTWVASGNSFLSFRYTDYQLETSSRPDLLFSFPIATDGSVGLDLANLDRQGLLLVPNPIAGLDAYNLFIDPFIQRYGFLENGTRMGGGEVGGGSTITENDFFRENFQIGYDVNFGSGLGHELHLGYSFSRDEEDLRRLSNGWGVISVVGGRREFNDQPIFFEASFGQQSLNQAVRNIHSELESHNIEINDTMRLGDWSFNVGILASNDIFYGQGLREVSGNVSGFAAAPGHKYKMYEIDFADMIQPRLGAVWAYNQRDTVWASYARYNPAASSLPRAAAWDRNLATTIRAYFDANGNLFATDPLASSSGKFFADDLDPRTIDEYMIGTSRELGGGWTARANARYRYGYNFWEDTNNDARLRFDPPSDIPRELYIPNLDVVRGEIGGSSYVIAELDGAFSKYWEAGLEAEWRGRDAYFRGSYVWSHYYGNFDQDNTTVGNDASIFIGSSNLADGAGRQLWDFKYGDLRGDRRHQLKLFGYYTLPWNASVGAYGIYQSGQPWEIWDSEVYRALTTSTSDTNRYAEPAGSRTTDSHYQLDLNYTQSFKLGERFDLQLVGDVFNVTDNQTGYDVDPRRSSATFREPRKYFDPRRFQLAVRFLF